MVVAQTSPKAGAEIRNEGTPFRCLGLHTHWKAPAEAQTRFSEDTLQPKFYRMEIDAAQPDTTGRPNMTRRTHSIYQVAGPPSTNPDKVSQMADLPRTPSTTQSGCAGLRNRCACGRHHRQQRLRNQNRLRKREAVSKLEVLGLGWRSFRLRGSARLWFGGEVTCSSFPWFVSWPHS